MKLNEPEDNMHDCKGTTVMTPKMVNFHLVRLYVYHGKLLVTCVRVCINYKCTCACVRVYLHVHVCVLVLV